MIEGSVAEAGSLAALRIARGVGTEGIAEAVLEGEIDAAYGMFLLALLERGGVEE